MFYNIYIRKHMLIAQWLLYRPALCYFNLSKQILIGIEGVLVICWSISVTTVILSLEGVEK
jgi:hypothetical protein